MDNFISTKNMSWQMGVVAKKKRSVIETLKSWAKKSTLRAFSIILNSNSSLTRTLWTSFILLFAMILAKKASQLVDTYYEYEVRTVVQQGGDVDTRSSSCTFPADVTIKLINWLDFDSYVRTFWAFEEPKKYLRTAAGGPQQAFIEATDSFRAEYLIAKSKFSDELERSLRRELVEKAIVKCRFGNKTCGIDDFELIEGQSFQPVVLRLNTTNHRCDEYVCNIE